MTIIMKNATRFMIAAAMATAAFNSYAEGPVDMTSAIRANQFYNEWHGTTLGWNNNDFVAEIFNQNQIEVYQILANMPAGIYTLECNAFERPAQRLNAAPENPWSVNTFIYVKPGTSFARKNNVDQYTEDALDVYTYGVPVKFLYDEEGYTYDPYTYPNTMTQAKNAFEAGQYLNVATCTLDEAGPLRFGITIPTQWGRFWICFDNFKLYYQESEDSEKVDYTAYITNPDFSADPARNAWTNYPSTGYEDVIKSRACEWYRRTIDMSQTISGLEAGRYKVVCNAFRRDYAEVTMFANDHELNIADFWSINDEFEGLSNKQSMTGAGDLFALGFYKNAICLDLADGQDLTIGLKKEGTGSTDWVASNGFFLYYLPAIEAPTHNLELEGAEYAHDFINLGSKVVEFTHPAATVYYKWEAEQAATYSIEEGYAEVPEGGLEIAEPGTLSYYAENEEGQRSEIKTISIINGSSTSSIDAIATENVPAEYYTLQGIRIDNPAKGSIVIVKQGSKARKTIIK